MLAALPIGAALSAGGLGWRWSHQAAGAGLRALSADEYAIAQAIGSAWMPSGGDPPLSGADANVGAFLDEVVARLDGQTRPALKLLLHLLDDAPLLTHGCTFRDLSADTSSEVLQGWLDGPLPEERGAIAGLLVLIADAYTTHPTVAAMLAPMFGCGFGR